MTATALAIPQDLNSTTINLSDLAEPPCTFCLHLLDSDEPCGNCGEHYCRHCLCPCSNITEDHALAAAHQRLWRNPLTTTQTMLVEDEDVAVYATSGPGDCFLQKPEYESDCVSGIHLKPEFIGKHEHHHHLAIRTDENQMYTTEHYSVTVRNFRIEGRKFTMTVFTPNVAPKIVKRGARR